MSRLSPDDRKYLGFQIWQEGIARYTQVRCAEESAGYQPRSAYRALADYQPFSAAAAKARAESLRELSRTDLAGDKRNVAYSFGAAEGFLLDRVDPRWKLDYFEHPLSLDTEFARLR